MTLQCGQHRYAEVKDALSLPDSPEVKGAASSATVTPPFKRRITEVRHGTSHGSLPDRANAWGVPHITSERFAQDAGDFSDAAVLDEALDSVSCEGRGEQAAGMRHEDKAPAPTLPAKVSAASKPEPLSSSSSSSTSEEDEAEEEVRAISPPTLCTLARVATV